jgi:hypothetical protein
VNSGAPDKFADPHPHTPIESLLIWFGIFMHIKIRGMNHSKNFRLMYSVQ